MIIKMTKFYIETGYYIYFPITVQIKSKESIDSQIKVSIKAKNVIEDYENQRSVINFIERVMNK